MVVSRQYGLLRNPFSYQQPPLLPKDFKSTV